MTTPAPAPAAVAAVVSVKLKCVRRGCRETTEALRVCANINCGRPIHHACYLDLLGENETLPKDMVVCTVKCYQKMAANVRKPSWNNDGANGPGDPNTSEKILLDWLTDEGNYSRYRGKNNNGVKKIQFAQRLADAMNAQGVKVKRDSKQVMAKITYLENSFKNAYDWANTETGAGLMEQGAMGSFEAEVKRRCPFYNDLLPIMKDRSSAKPMVTSEDLDAPLAVEDNNDNLLDSSDDDSVFEARPTPGVPTAAAERARTPPNLRNPSSGEKGTIGATLSIRRPAPIKRKQQSGVFEDEEKERLGQLTMKKLEAAAMDNQRKSTETRMYNLHVLKKMRRENPELSRAEILAWMPELEDAANLVWKEVAQPTSNSNSKNNSSGDSSTGE
jgi:hypothetical protein